MGGDNFVQHTFYLSQSYGTSISWPEIIIQAGYFKYVLPDNQFECSINQNLIELIFVVQYKILVHMYFTE